MRTFVPAEQVTSASPGSSAPSQLQYVMTVHYWKKLTKQANGPIETGTRSLAVKAAGTAGSARNRFVLVNEATGQEDPQKEVQGIYRVVFYDDTVSTPAVRRPWLVVDVNADAEHADDSKLTIKPRDDRPDEATLSVWMLCVLNAKSRAKITAGLKTAPPAAPGVAVRFFYDNFTVVANPTNEQQSIKCEFIKSKDGSRPTMRLVDAIAEGKIYPLDHRGLLTPGHLTSDDHGLALNLAFKDDKTLKTLISFPLKNKTFGDTQGSEAKGGEDFRVFRFELKVDNKKLEPTTIRTFVSKEKLVDFDAAEANGDWTFVQRPTSLIDTGPATENREHRPPAATWLLHIDGVPARAAFIWWNQLRRPYHDAFTRIQGSSPLSFVPQPDLTPGAGSFARATMTYRIEDRGLDADDERSWDFRGDEDADRSEIDTITVFPTSIEVWRAKTAGAHIGATLPQLRATVSGKGLQDLCIPLPPPDARPPGAHVVEFQTGAIIRTRGPIWVAPLAKPAAAAKPAPPVLALGNRTVRVGALDLVFGDTDTGQDAPGILSLSGDSVSVLQCQFSVARIGPGGQDAATLAGRDARDAETVSAEGPLIVWNYDASAAATDSTRYLLSVEETADPHHSQALTLNLQALPRSVARSPSAPTASVSTSPPHESVIVIDRNPFLVAEVRYPQFQSKATSQNSEIASWANTGVDAGSWQLLFEQEPFDLALPPQGIGEQMIRAHETGEDGTKAMDFDLSPVARLTLDPGVTLGDFSEAPWNLRRILGTPGAPQAGPLVKRFDYELLYGLTCRVDNPAIRLAEIFSRIGRIPPLRRLQDLAWADRATSAQIEAYRGSVKAWKDVFRRYLSRIAVLEPWDDILLRKPANTVVLKEGLVCHFRLPPASNLKLPFELTGSPNGTLAGGATRGFESRNVLQATVLNDSAKGDVKPVRQSDSAELSDFYLSSLGGWGRQMAGFQGNLTKVYGDVAMGRTYRYKVERLGRIGVFWNLAKHVVVYERTVVPSKQFASSGRDKPPAASHEQHALSGWPVLRKVREFVEIIEDTRQFPDTTLDTTTGAEAESLRRARGFVANITFPPGARFNVLSSWGSDIEDTGWKVPLWNPAASPADVYPRPKIALGVVTGDAGRGEIVPCDIAEPQQLVFYTQTKVKAAGGTGTTDPDKDPHKWAPVVGIDFVNAPTSKPLETDFAGGDPRQYAANDSPAAPGYGVCTFKLRPPSMPVNIVAERTRQPLSAVLETVTMVRGRPKATSWPNEIQPVAALELQLIEGCKPLLQQLPLKTTAISGTTAADVERISHLLSTANPFGALADGTTKAKAAVKSVRDALLKQLTDFEQNTCANAKRQLQVAFDAPLRNFDEELTAIVSSAPPAKAQLLEMLEELRAGGENVLLLVEGLPGVADRFLERYAGLAIELHDRVKVGIDAELRQIDDDIANRRPIRDFMGRTRELLAEVQSLVDAFDSVGRQRPAPWIPDPTEHVKALLHDYWQPFRNAADNLLNTLRTLDDGAHAEARKALAAFRREYIDKFAAPNDVVTYLKNIGLEIPSRGSPTYMDVRRALEHVEDWRAKVLAAWRDAITTARKAVDTAPDAQAALGALRPQKAALREWAVGDSGVLTTRVNELCARSMDRLSAVATMFLGRLDTLENEIDGVVKGFEKALKEAQKVPAELECKLRKALDDHASKVREYLEHAAGLISKDKTDLWDMTETAIRVVRAYGEPPRVPKLAFERERLGYYYDAVAPRVDLTPVTSIVTQAAEVQESAARIENALKPLGVRMPTVAALDQLLPATLQGFDVSRIFPDFAGLNLEHLFTGLKLPNLSSEHVKITHGLDVQTRRAFVRADVDVPIAERATVFTFGPLSLQLPSARFTAATVIETNADGRVSRRANGRISGAWQLVISNTALVEFEGTELFFDDGGGIRFSIDPKRIKLPGVMAFLTKAMESFSGKDDGLSFGLTPDAFRCLFSLPVPDVQLGAFGMSNIRLSAAVALKFAPQFAIGLDFGIARKEAPFALTIFILGGGGFLRITSTYTPASRKFDGEIELAITVSASLAIALGPIKGGVYVYFGITAHYQSGTGLDFGVLFIVRGEVNVLGIASACIVLMLQATYNSQTNALVGVGGLSIRIKICWCFTLEVDQDVTYTLASGGEKHARAEPRVEGLVAWVGDRTEPFAIPQGPAGAILGDDPFTRAARAYVDMLV
jgi:hypothetical protein